MAKVILEPIGRRRDQFLPEEIWRLHRPAIEAARVVTTEISQLPLPAVRRVLEIAREGGARTVLDLDVPQKDAVPALGSERDLQAALASADIAEGRLVKLFETTVPIDFAYYLLCPERKAALPKVALFRDWLTAAARAEPGECG